MNFPNVCQRSGVQINLNTAWAWNVEIVGEKTNFLALTWSTRTHTPRRCLSNA